MRHWGKILQRWALRAVHCGCSIFVLKAGQLLRTGSAGTNVVVLILEVPGRDRLHTSKREWSISLPEGRGPGDYPASKESCLVSSFKFLVAVFHVSTNFVKKRLINRGFSKRLRIRRKLSSYLIPECLVIKPIHQKVRISTWFGRSPSQPFVRGH